jgi:hypothetical protein
MYGVSLESARSMAKDLGPIGFAWKVQELLGLGVFRDGRFHRHVDPDSGRPVLESTLADGKTPRLKPEAIRSAILAEVLLGFEKHDLIQQSPRAMREVDVMEASMDVTPSKFANISAFNSAVAGLLEAKFLEVWQSPNWLADQLVQNEPTMKRSEKFIGISNIGDVAMERKPGNRHVRAELSERFVETPDTVNHGVAIDVTREADMFDLTTQLFRQAESAAETLRRRKEYRILDVFLGITNTYKYNGTATNTYLTAGAYINDRSLPFVDWKTFNTALQAFVDLNDPETNEPLDVHPTQLFCMPGKWSDFRKALTDTEVESRTPTTMAVVARGKNPFAGFVEIVPTITYPYAFKRAKAPDGLNLSAVNATEYWWLGNFKKAFGYLENLPLLIQRPAASDYEMADRGLVFSLFADEMGVPFVKEPRHVQRFKN